MTIEPIDLAPSGRATGFNKQQVYGLLRAAYMVWQCFIALSAKLSMDPGVFLLMTTQARDFKFEGAAVQRS